MDESIPLKVRQRYAVASFALFLTVLAATVLYATGYRIHKGEVAATGAISVYVPIAGATVTLDGKEVGKSSLLSKEVYVGDLAPGTYAVDATAEGYYPWHKSLLVESKLVSETTAFLATEDPIVTVLAPGTHLAIAALFATSTAREQQGALELSVESGKIVLRFAHELAEAPPAFCIAPGSCALSFTVWEGDEPALAANFYDGGVVFKTKSGVYITEVDIKHGRVVVPLYLKSGADYRVERHHLYIKDGTVLYEVAGI